MSSPINVKDTFLTIAAPSEGHYRDRGSKFTAFAYSVATDEEIRQRQDDLRKIHPKATHHCYAWRLGMDKNNFRANDDGEPSGTAGRPILGQIDSFGLTNVLIIVVRYYGGTNLGTGGLIEAYKSSANEALQAANIIEKIVEGQIRVIVPYGALPEVMSIVKKLEASILSQSYTEDVDMLLSIRNADLSRLIEALEETRQVQIK